MKNGSILIPALLMFAAVSFESCGGENSPSKVVAPGDDKTAKDVALDAGSKVLQDKTPLSRFSTYLDGFHFYNGNMNAQMEAHHYVSQLNEDLYQAIIFDGNDEDAKIMGIEYIISAKLFDSLDREEKYLWHSHHHEVKSGTLVAPGIPLAVENELMEKIVNTYGKTIHTWHTDQERRLPVGAPMLMMGFTKDGQVHTELVATRDKRLGISTQKIRESRLRLPTPSVSPDANAWEKGVIRQFIISTNADSAKHKHQAKP